MTMNEKCNNPQKPLFLQGTTCNTILISDDDMERKRQILIQVQHDIVHHQS
jgi:hypothetical protein